MTEHNISEHGFIGLVTTFYIACWQQMGKVANPITNKIERNLDQAKYSIDMLIMLKEKTKGNLNKEEEKSLDQAIANLQMNYVDELNKPAEEPSQKTDKKTGESSEKEKEEKTDVQKEK